MPGTIMPSVKWTTVWARCSTAVTGERIILQLGLGRDEMWCLVGLCLTAATLSWKKGETCSGVGERTV